MINWGIIGYGGMGKQYANCFQKKNSIFNLIGIASKTYNDLINNKDLKFFNNYEDLISHDLVDAIYIATLNNTHKDLVIKANEKNKKILCEKPLGMNSSEVNELHNLFKDKKDNFIEAIAYRSHPQTINLINLLNEKEIGNIKKIEANFGFKVKKIDKDSRLFNEKFGGGSILDLGCYPLSFFNLFKKEKEKEMKVINSKINSFVGNVDIDGEIFLKIDDNIDAIGKVSLKENLNNSCKLYCDNAIITLKEPWIPSNKTFIEIETKSRYFKKIISSNKNVYEHQLELSSIFFSKKFLKSNLLVDIDESLQLAKIIEIWKSNRS
tara:strand:+ start:1565 stop:2533 length:969 start_codon:yes stop_codon:yes gene_type:complete